jgi:hypothetical protein
VRSYSMSRAALASWFVIFLSFQIYSPGTALRSTTSTSSPSFPSQVYSASHRRLVAAVISWQQLPGRLVLCSSTSCTSDAPLALASACSCPRRAAR